MKVKVSKVGQPDVYVPAYEADGKTLNVDGVQADSTLQSSISAVTTNSYGVTTNAAILTNDEVFADTTSGIITLTLPASPATGNRVRVLDPKGTWGTNKCVIARNGNKIAGFSSDLELTVSGDSVELVFYSTTSDWRIP